MRSKFYEYLDLLLIFLITFLAILSFAINVNPPFHHIFNLLFLLFCPGYSILAIVFPKEGELSLSIRSFASIAVSITFFILFGMIMNQTQWGINKLYFGTLCGLLVMIFTGLSAYIRSRQDQPLQLAISKKSLSVIIVIIPLIVIFANEFRGRVQSPKLTTQLYLEPISTEERSGFFFPERPKVVIVNREGKIMRYLVYMQVNQDPKILLDDVELKDQESEEIEFEIGALRYNSMPTRVSFMIYVNSENEQAANDSEPYRQIYFWVGGQE